MNTPAKPAACPKCGRADNMILHGNEWVCHSTHPIEPIPPNIPALSIRQPWANAIIHLGKDIENRTWHTEFRGRVLIHASKTKNREERDGFIDLTDSRNIKLLATLEESPGVPSLKLLEEWMDGLPMGGIIGEAEIVDCVSVSSSPWFVGPYGFVLRNVKPLPFTPCVGRLGFFYPKLP